MITSPRVVRIDAAGKPTRLLAFIPVSVIPVAFVWISTHSVVAATVRSDAYSHIPLIPVLSFYPLCSDRRPILWEPRLARRLGFCC